VGDGRAGQNAGPNRVVEERPGHVDVVSHDGRVLVIGEHGDRVQEVREPAQVEPVLPRVLDSHAVVAQPAHLEVVTEVGGVDDRVEVLEERQQRLPPDVGVRVDRGMLGQPSTDVDVVWNSALEAVGEPRSGVVTGRIDVDAGLASAFPAVVTETEAEEELAERPHAREPLLVVPAVSGPVLVVGQFHLYRAEDVAFSQVGGQRAAVLLDDRVGGTEAPHQRVAERRLDRRVGMLSAERTAVERRGPRVQIHGCVGEPVRDLSEPVGVPHRGVHVRRDRSVAVVVGLEVDARVSEERLPFRVVRVQRLDRVHRRREVDFVDTHRCQSLRGLFGPLVDEVPRVGPHGRLHADHLVSSSSG